MIDQNEMIIQYKDGTAEAIVGTRAIRVGRRDADGRNSFCPVELVTSALGTWIVLTIAAVAENKDINLEDIEVRISRTSDEINFSNTQFDLKIELSGELSKRERILLFNSARNCEVHKLLKGEMRFVYHLQNE